MRTKNKSFQGVLPTTIYPARFSKVYGQNPDIDSTALMISTSSWILVMSLSERQQSSSLSGVSKSPQTATAVSEHYSEYILALPSKAGITDPQKVSEFVVPRKLKAIDSLSKRDIDNGLLDQDHNEDWMDTYYRSNCTRCNQRKSMER